MKLLITGTVGAVLSMTAGLIFLPSCVSAQGKSAFLENSSLIIPPSAVRPLGTLSSEELPLFDVSSDDANIRVDTGSAGLSTRVAPGELFPVSIKISNFGGGKRVDILMSYGIFSSAGDEIYLKNETVAVETTASYVRTIQIPFSAVPGIYTAKTSITYEGQLVPASTQFPFKVERKIFGLFQSDFFLYGSITLLISIVIFFLGRTAIKNYHRERFTPFDYSAIPRDERTFYEILSDTIMQMRERVGDDALLIASRIDGLKIDTETGKVLALTSRPGKVVAELVSEYEKLLGKKVSFSFRDKKTDL